MSRWKIQKKKKNRMYMSFCVCLFACFVVVVVVAAVFVFVLLFVFFFGGFLFFFGGGWGGRGGGRRLWLVLTLIESISTSTYHKYNHFSGYSIHRLSVHYCNHVSSFSSRDLLCSLLASFYSIDSQILEKKIGL